MNYTGPYTYNLFLGSNAKKSFIERKEQNCIVTNFKFPVTAKKRPKIYIVKAGEVIVYVGYASQSIGSRLSHGFRANGDKGYYGYKWKDKYDAVELHVFVFDAFIGNDEDKKHKAFVEAVEAELVYKVRTETGNWPEHQNEIHFNNNQRTEVLEIAASIYNTVTT